MIITPLNFHIFEYTILVNVIALLDLLIIVMLFSNIHAVNFTLNMNDHVELCHPAEIIKNADTR